MTKFKVALQKELLQVDKVLVILTGDTSFHSQGLHSAINDLVIMQHRKVSCILTVNGDMHLFR